MFYKVHGIVGIIAGRGDGGADRAVSGDVGGNGISLVVKDCFASEQKFIWNKLRFGIGRNIMVMG